MGKKSFWFAGRTRVRRTPSQKHRQRKQEAAATRKSADDRYTGASAHFIDPDEEREPPQTPTPISFPQVDPLECRSWSHVAPPPNFQALFTRVLKPTDIAEKHVEALNIELRPQCSVEEMLPAAIDGSSYLPTLEFGTVNQASESNAATKMNDDATRKRKAFADRVAELELDNITAYRVITRNFQSGASKPPRLAYMRTFWQGMESMSQYWDCTMDQHYSVSKHEDNGEKSPKRQKLDSEVDASEDTTAGAYNGLPVRTTDGENVSSTDARISIEQSESSPSDDLAVAEDPQIESAVPPPSITKAWHLRPRKRYKGLRTNAGRQMPDQFRVEMTRGFVEGTVWPFQCNVHPPRMLPLVHFSKLKLPVRQSHAVYRLPTDRDRARAGGLVGPVLGVQVRSDVEFERDEAKARLDVMREIGGLLQLAQERAREGKTESKPGEGKWWTTAPRWGGGPGGEVENQDGNSDIVAVAAELLADTKNGSGKAGKDTSMKRQKKTPAMLWKELKCGSGYFDPKTDYAAIGKDPASEVDEVRSVPTCL